tara:strand:- start:17169 stop:17405 length:237 start_codon:yes stop_codon:yes gene_type:complete
MKINNPKLQVCIDLTMRDADLRQRRVKLLQLLEIMDKSNAKLATVGATPSQENRDDRTQLVRLLLQTKEFTDSREALL